MRGLVAGSVVDVGHYYTGGGEEDVDVFRIGGVLRGRNVSQLQLVSRWLEGVLRMRPACRW